MPSRFVFVFVLLLAGGCKLTTAECEEFSEHFVGLMTRAHEGASAEVATEVAKGLRESVVRDCVDKGTRAQLDCAMKAQALGELDRCNAVR